MALPILDLSVLNSGDAERRQTLANKLTDILLEHGFTKLSNHGIDKAMVGEMFSWSRRFFALDAETKQQIEHHPGPHPQRGFSGVGSENTARLFSGLANSAAGGQSDAKEHFDMGPPNDIAFPNRWPQDKQLPGFRPFLEECFERCETITRIVLEALEIGLCLPQGTFNDLCTHDQNESEFRLMHYPSIGVADMRRQNRISPHFDLGVITLLFQDDVGGLQMENRKRSGTFVPVLPSSPADMVVNISETLQRWTKNTLRAGLHRVTLPTPM